MRGGILALGIILLVVGGLIFMKGHNGVKDCESTWGEIGQIISEEAREKCEMYQQMETFGGIIGVVGFVISIAGAVSSKQGRE